MLKGCDISHWQGDVEFGNLITDFCIFKVTEGINFIDPKWIRNRDGLRNSGKMLGYYHFARPNVNSAESEASFFMKTIGTPKEGEVLVLDFEVSVKNAVSWCKQWLDYVSQNMNGCKPLIYMDKSRLNGYDWQPVVDAGYGLWIASYDKNPDLRPPCGKWAFAAMKQYDNVGVVTGIQGGVDMDAFYGTHTSFRKYGYHAPLPSPIPSPIPAPLPEPPLPEPAPEPPLPEPTPDPIPEPPSNPPTTPPEMVSVEKSYLTEVENGAFKSSQVAHILSQNDWSLIKYYKIKKLYK